MASGEDTETALEAAEADARDQLTPVADEPEESDGSTRQAELSESMEADEGDVLDQAIVIPPEDEPS